MEKLGRITAEEEALTINSLEASISKLPEGSDERKSLEQTLAIFKDHASKGQIKIRQRIPQRKADFDAGGHK